MKSDLVWSLIFLAFPFCFAACGGTTDKPARDPETIAKSCAPLAAVEARFVADVTAACDAKYAEDPELCPEFTAIDAEYAIKRAEAARECTK